MEFLKTFFISIVSAIGAFFPILGMMYIHFRIRKNFYNQLKIGFERELESLKKSVDDYNRYLNVHRQRFNFKDEFDLVFNQEIKNKFSNEKDYEFFLNYYNNLENWKNSFNDKKIKKEIDLNYIKKYNFRRYLIGLLNDRFPDQYFRTNSNE
ncbi:MAG: hypothetical protein CEN91_449 [Candidatus Berkelbacteria bacterium Licking1014_85]|uniref:Uncharacterized protein n=1 Tax=Candidatus Berkelbacteria bacterium Licking1014_85 TaxID=2017148 RepID=A0A554LHW3_9BACT|nr:MAG: hypothetical protein CEN91_449 [Candidatus Berkelbacteria bacterium Licking1014_85]